MFRSCLFIGYQDAASSSALPAIASHILCPSSLATGRELVTSFEILVEPWSPALPATKLHGVSDAVMTSALDASAWLLQSQSLGVLDVGKPDSIMPKDCWNGSIQTGFSRWSAGCPMKRVDLRWSMAKSVKPRPLTDYAQVGQPALSNGAIKDVSVQLTYMYIHGTREYHAQKT